ncbi:RHS repeat-associated core domain-containing protein [Halosimplex amylolyticum]|uniref:RHS repeat-associated core domain-containing protein n=1 Tax=Halosimplex amylolyticum TaxID=3396616 RepID=UPI003F5700DF
MAPPYTFEASEPLSFEYTDLDGETHHVEVSPGDPVTMADACEAFNFVLSAEKAGVPVVGDAEAIEAECLDKYRAVFEEHRNADVSFEPELVEVPGATGDDEAPADGAETAASLNAPDPEPPVSVSASPRAPGEDDGRPLAEQYHDPEDPMPEYDVVSALSDRGVAPDELDEKLREVVRNEAPDDDVHREFARDDREDPFTLVDPVDVFSGQYVKTETDVEIPSRGLPLRFERVYGSGPVSHGPLGYNWDHNYNVFLRPLPGGDVAVWTGQRSEDHYRRQPDGSYEPPTGVFRRLDHRAGSAATPERYVIVDADGRRQVFERPDSWPHGGRIPLVRLEDRHGNAIRCSYDAEGRLARVEDDAGQHLAFTYGDRGRLTAVDDHTGRRWRYAFDRDADHLVAVTTPVTDEYPDGLTTRYKYDRYDDHPRLRHTLRRVIDPSGTVVVENEYGDDPATDDFGRVVRQTFGEFEATFSATRLQWVPRTPEAINVPAWRVAVVDPGILVVYTFNYRGDLLDERRRLALDGSYRLHARAFEYDERGNLVAQREPSGLGLDVAYDAENDDPRARGNALRAVLTAPPTAAVLDRELFRVTYEDRYHRPKTVRDERGATTTLVYDYEESPTDRGDVVRVEHPDATLPDGTVQDAAERITYDGAGRITARETAAGFRHEFAYDDAGQLTAATMDVDGVGQTQRFAYDERGDLTRVTDGAGNTHEYEHDALGWLSRVRLPAVDGDVAEVRYRYDPTGRPRREELPRGTYDDDEIEDSFIANEYRYDALGHVTRAVFGANTAEPRRWHFDRDDEDRVTRVVDPLGNRTDNRYDERGRLLEQTAAAGTADAATWRLVYDRNGNRTAVVDPDGFRTDTEFDPWDRVRRVRRPGADGERTVVEYEHGERNHVTGIEIRGLPRPDAPVDVLGAVTYEYDERSRPVERTVAGRTRTAWYDRDGRLVREVDEAGAETSFETDGLGRVVATTDALGNRTRWEFDGADDPTAVEALETAPDGSTTAFRTTFAYDARQHLVAVTDPLGNTHRTEYDARGLPVGFVDPLGHRVAHRYDLDGALVARTTTTGDPSTAVEHRWNRDRLGRVTRYVDPEGAETRFEHTAHHGLAAIEYDDGSVWEGTYRPGSAGRLESERSADGTRRTYAYDTTGEIRRIAFSPGPDVAATADLAMASDGLGRPVALQQGDTTLERRYDAHGRITSETLDGREFAVDYDDGAGTVDLTYPDGRRHRTHLDALGRVASVDLTAVGSAALTGPDVAAGDTLVEYEYAGPTRPARRRLWNGTETEYEYDGGQRLTGLSHRQADGSLLAATRYAHDGTGRRRVVHAEPAPLAPTSYGYDDLSRLTERVEGVDADAPPPVSTQADADAYVDGVETTDPTASEAFAVNLADDRLEREVQGPDGRVTESYDVTRMRQIESLTRTTDADPPTTTEFAYSNAGPLRSDDRYRYTYDALHRPVRVADSSGATVAELAYDPAGRLRRRTVDGETTGLVHFANHCLQEDDDGGEAVLQRAVGIGVDELLVQSTGTNAWGHQDAVDTLLATSDDGGRPSERYAYRAFGEPAIFAPDGTTRRSSSAVGAGPVFAGHAVLTGTGLYPARARLYDPVTGRFAQRDPHEFGDSACPYVYAAHDPVNFVDPSGRFILAALVIGALVGAGVGLAYGLGRGHTGWRLAGDVALGGSVGAAAGLTGGLAAEALAGTVGVGTFATGAGTATTTASLTSTQTAVLTGSMGVIEGYVTRQALSSAYPSVVEPPSTGTMVEDFGLGAVAGGAMRAADWIGRARNRATVPEIAPQTGSDASVRGTVSPTEATPMGSGSGPGAPPSSATGSPPREPLPAGHEPYQLELFPSKPFERVKDYGSTPTPRQRAAVPPGMWFDHAPPKVVHYFEGPGGGRLPGYNLTEQERKAWAASLESGRPATPESQWSQGGELSGYSKRQKKKWGLLTEREKKKLGLYSVAPVGALERQELK